MAVRVHEAIDKIRVLEVVLAEWQPRAKTAREVRRVRRASPAAICDAASITAFRPDPQTLLIVVHGTEFGIPAPRLACRAGA